MISNGTMRTQVGRLMRLPYVPREPEDMKGLAEEYKRVISDRCRDDAHAIRTINAVMDTPREQLLTPGDIVQAANGTTTDAPPQGFPGCDECGFSGWKVKKIGTYDYSLACECRSDPKPPVQPSRKRKLEHI